VVALIIIILSYPPAKPPGPTLPPRPPIVSVEEQISLGERLLIQYKPSLKKTKGIRAIKRYLNEGKPQKNDPEAWIYLNNAIATVQKVEQNASIQKIAALVYVPGDQENEEKKWGHAEEILRGVAQAQTQFNCGIDNLGDWVESNQNNKLQCPGTGNKFLQVAIAIYRNPDEAKAVTQTIVNDPDRFGFGVVGRYPSDILQQVAPIYQKGKRVVVAPTSNAVRKTQSNDSRKEVIELNEYIFRMVPDSSSTARVLRQKLLDENLAVVYEHGRSYSESQAEEIGLEFKSNAVVLDGEECNLKPGSNFNAGDCINNINKLQGISYVFISPSLGNLNNTLDLIKHIDKQHLPLKLLGSDTMYDEDLLEQVGQAAFHTKLWITVPWARSNDGSTPFEQNAAKLFGTAFINWRTAMAYDATLALINGLENAASPEALQRKLSSKSFSVLEETATGTLRFRNGDRIPDNNLRISVQVVPDNSSEYKYNFQRNDNPT
jgi:branched-chain amino acid transport system substrate-binding protein